MIHASRMTSRLAVALPLLALLTAGCERAARYTQLAGTQRPTMAQAQPTIAADFNARVQNGTPLMVANVMERNAVTTFALGVRARRGPDLAHARQYHDVHPRRADDRHARGWPAT